MIVDRLCRMFSIVGCLSGAIACFGFIDHFPIDGWCPWVKCIVTER